MGTVHFITTKQPFRLRTKPGKTIFECLREANIPLHSALLVGRDGEFVSLTEVLGDEDEVWAYSLRNVDFACVRPVYDFVPSVGAVTELIRPTVDPRQRALVQFSRAEALDYIYESVKTSLHGYLRAAQKAHVDLSLQISLSSGGDGRVLAESIRRFWDDNPEVSFHCLIVGAGFEDEQEQVGNAIKIANQFDLPYTAFTVREAGIKLGYGHDIKEILDRYRREFPDDSPEAMSTYLLQQLNFEVAREAGRRGIIFGYNQEDVIAERLYQLMTGKMLGPYPVRRLNEFDIIAPLYMVPKRMLDAVDIDNSIRNYRLRTPCTTYIRSSLFLLAYLITEQFPALADVLSGGTIEGGDVDLILRWLEAQERH